MTRPASTARACAARIGRTLAGAGLVALLAACSTIEPPDITLADVRMPPAGGGLEQRIEADLRLVNPNDKPITIDGMVVDLTINDQRLSRGVSSQKVELGRLSDSKVTVPFLVNALSVLGGLVGILTGGGSIRDGLAYGIEGHAFVIVDGSRSQVPFKKSGQVSVTKQ